MSRFGRQGHLLSICAGMAVRLYLVAYLAGCASTPPKPEGEQLRSLQVRSYPAEMKTVFHAAVDALQDIDFGIDMANADAGVITATRQTDRRLARITRQDDHGLPAWAWVVLIATGVIIIAAVIAVMSSSDDDGKKDSSSKDKDKGPGAGKEQAQDQGKSEGKASRRGTTPGTNDTGTKRDTIRVAYKEKNRNRTRHEDERRHDEPTVVYYGYDEPASDVIIIGGDSPQQREWHQYRITLNFDNPSGNETKVRMSVQGARIEGSEVKEAGPVYDAEFYQMYFSHLERALKAAEAEGPVRGDGAK